MPRQPAVVGALPRQPRNLLVVLLLLLLLVFLLLLLRQLGLLLPFLKGNLSFLMAQTTVVGRITTVVVGGIRVIGSITVVVVGSITVVVVGRIRVVGSVMVGAVGMNEVTATCN